MAADQSRDGRIEKSFRPGNHRCRLLGVSETSGDVRDLLAREAAEVRAAEVEEVDRRLRRRARGLDTLVFSCGIGENSPVVYVRACDGLDCPGVRLEPERTPTMSRSSLPMAAGFYLAGDVIERVPQFRSTAAYAKQSLREKLIEHRECICRHGEDLPEVCDWRWAGKARSQW